MSAREVVPPEEFRQMFAALQQELGRVIVGQHDIVRGLLIAFFANGHVLLEGVPGRGKTLLGKSFAQALGLSFKRIQFTPDLMPADILGTEMVVERDGHKRFEFSPGPVFTHILLSDELNRATPKTQSALLEAMAEHQVSVAGKTYRLEEPFFVIATQNPIEMEGVYSLPEAQLDRFLFRLLVGYPTPEELGEILRRTTVVEEQHIAQVLPQGKEREWILQARRLVREVLVARAVEDYVVQLITATRPDDRAGAGASGEDGRQAGDGPQRLIRYGTSPRGAQAILMGAKVLALVRGRVNVSFEDVDDVMLSALNHRIVLSFEAEAERRTSSDILRDVTASVHAVR